MCFSQEGKKLRFFRSSLLKIYLCATRHSKRYDRVQLGVLSTSTDSHPSYKYVHNEINLRLSTGNSSRDYAPAFPFPLTRSLRRVDGYKRSSRKCLYLHARALLVKNLFEFSAKVKPRIPVALLAQSARNTCLICDFEFHLSMIMSFSSFLLAISFLDTMKKRIISVYSSAVMQSDQFYRFVREINVIV